MSRTNIDIDEVACERVMRRFSLTTKKDAVNTALRLVIVIDSSAWIEFFRRPGSPTAVSVRRALRDGFATCDPVRLEVLAGARDEKHLSELRRLLSRGQDVPVGPSQHEEAASLHRQRLRQGRIVRKMMDCLIAAAAVSVDAAVLQHDADFDALAACTALRSA